MKAKELLGLITLGIMASGVQLSFPARADSSAAASATDQTVPGAGNADAAALAASSPRVRDALQFLESQAGRIGDPGLRKNTLEALRSGACIQHRRGIGEAEKQAVVSKLIAEGLVSSADGTSFPGGLKAGIFPPVLDESSDCPHTPQPFASAPGGAFHSHHSHPGGLAVHEAFNDRSSVSLAQNYRANYPAAGGEDGDDESASFFIDQDVILAAPIWHDWAKSVVFQWNADGTEFVELNFGGAGKTDAFGAPGDSRAGGHHILGVAETIKRGLPPAFVIAQACAHSNPTLGNEYKVVNWLRAAAVIARVDPVAAGYLRVDGKGNFRLPALRTTGSLDLNAATPSQVNLLPEYTIHNLSDADFSFTVEAAHIAEVVLAKLALRFGFDPADAVRYNTRYRNPALAFVSAERLVAVYDAGGLDAVAAELESVREAGAIR